MKNGIKKKRKENDDSKILAERELHKGLESSFLGLKITTGSLK